MEETSTEAASLHCRPQEDRFALVLRIESRLSQIRLVRAALRGVLLHLGVAEGDAEFSALAAAEILTNSIEHGLNGDEGRQIELCLSMCGAELELTVHDDAPPFPEEDRMRVSDTSDLEDPSDQWSTRGHGVKIVRSIVDSLSVTREQNGNCIRMKKLVAMQRP